MAKESMKARGWREKRYAEKRKALLEAGDFVGLQKLPKTLHCSFT
jgi:small subunit ribosomal protein S14